MRTRLTRRDLLLAGGAAALGVAGRELWRGLAPKIPVADQGHLGPKLGHRLRTQDLPPPSEFLKQHTVIVGGGISGLSAAHHLHELGVEDFSLWELERSWGGNSIYGENSVSRFPWGAHYLPLPALTNTPLLKFLEKIKVIRGYRNGLPEYEELYACHDPQERCQSGQSWSAGLLPVPQMSEADHAELARFSALMDGFHAKTGRDGKTAFAIPVRASSRDEEFLRYDRLSMAQFLTEHEFHSEPLKWYVDYCMRDDFGTTSADVSAWAGIHYFAARGGRAANLDDHAVLTWPEGNGWLADRLAEPVRDKIHSRQLVCNIKNEERGAKVHVYDQEKNLTREIAAEHVIYAAPRYTAFHVLDGYHADKSHFQYSTWMIANVTLEQLPPSFKGAPLSWDNIRYQSKLLGYVVATHQNITRFQEQTVVTVYWPITHEREARQWASARSDADWRRDVIAELELMHPGIESFIREMEFKIWGHAMIQPRVGFFSSPAAGENFGRVTFAHSDMSGISIFENAFEAGRLAALQVSGRKS